MKTLFRSFYTACSVLTLTGFILWTSFTDGLARDKGESSGSDSTPSKKTGRASGKHAALSSDVLSKKDIAYGSDPLQKLDVYYKAGFAAAPVIVFLHPGGWAMGTKDNSPTFVEFFTGQGCVVVTPDYRLTDKHQFPAGICDAASAVVWTKKNIATFGGDERKILISGHSAGGHMAAMIAYNPEGDWLKETGLKSNDIKVIGFIGSSGCYDFDSVKYPAREEHIKMLLGSMYPGKWNAAEPVNFASSDDPPGLIITGDKDGFLNIKNPKTGKATTNADKLAEALAAGGVDHQLVIVPDWDHGDINEGLPNNPELQATISAFIKKTVAKIEPR